MIVGVGIDIIEIERIEKAVANNTVFLKKLFTEREREYFQTRNNRSEVIAGNFAAKEAVAKALGVGFAEFGLKDIEVLRDTFGKPYVLLYNKAEKMLGNNSTIHVSISHCNSYAIANATIECWDTGLITNQEISIFNSRDKGI